MKICENLATETAINTKWIRLWIFHDDSVYAVTEYKESQSCHSEWDL